MGESWTLLHEHAVDGDLRKARRMVRSDDGSWDVRAEPAGKSVFYVACENGHVELATFLVVSQTA